jgi:transposase
MPYRVAAIDVHKKMLAVVVADVAVDGPYQLEAKRFGATDSELRRLADWFVACEVQEVVMESTAQYWRPVWAALEQHWQPRIQGAGAAGQRTGKLHLAQAQSNRGRRGRKNDFRDAERLLRRLVAGELDLSFVPDPEQRLWRTLTRRKVQLTQDRVRFRNRLEALLEQMHIKLSGQVSDLLGVSARRMLRALAEGEKDPAIIAQLADPSLRANQEQLRDALAASANLTPVYRRLLEMEVQYLDFLEQQMDQLDEEIAQVLAVHGSAVERLAEVPGLGVDSAQQIIAEVGPTAAAFASEKQLASWAGVCPGEEVSAEKEQSKHSPRGNRNLRRVLNQAAHAAVRAKGTIFELVFRRLKRWMPYQQAICAVAHRLCRLIWKILHQGVRYEERGPIVDSRAKHRRILKMVRELKRAGYEVCAPTTNPA